MGADLILLVFAFGKGSSGQVRMNVTGKEPVNKAMGMRAIHSFVAGTIR
jgi:hypothetical protein